MSYMLSRQGYLAIATDTGTPPDVFRSAIDAQLGRRPPGSPILASDDPQDRVTVFLIPVAKWSDARLIPGSALTCSSCESCLCEAAC